MYYWERTRSGDDLKLFVLLVHRVVSSGQNISTKRMYLADSIPLELVLITFEKVDRAVLRLELSWE